MRRLIFAPSSRACTRTERWRARPRAPRDSHPFEMKIAGEQTLSAPRERVWALFNDPERLSRLIPGLEKLEVISPTEFAGTLNVGIAAVKGVYTGKLKLDEVRPPEHYKMTVDGKGKQGFMRGSRTIDLVAKMMIGQFFAAAEAELKAEAAGTVARQGFLLNFWRYLVRLVRSL